MFARNSVITDCSSRQDNWRTGQLDGAPRQSLQARLNRKAADSPASKPTATQQSTGTGDRPAPSKQPSYRCRCEVHQHRGSPGSLEAAHQEQSGYRYRYHRAMRQCPGVTASILLAEQACAESSGGRHPHGAAAAASNHGTKCPHDSAQSGQTCQH